MIEIRMYILEAAEGCWLYKDEGEIRNFAKMIRAYNESELALWLECTNAEKDQWEAEHQPEEPIV